MTECHGPTVTPAKAGIQYSDKLQITWAFWITGKKYFRQDQQDWQDIFFVLCPLSVSGRNLQNSIAFGEKFIFAAGYCETVVI
jgi:hypothetical protein